MSPFPGEYPSFPRAAGTGRGRGKTSGELRGITGTGNSFDLEGVRGIFPEDYQNSNWGRDFLAFLDLPRSTQNMCLWQKARSYKTLMVLHRVCMWG